MDEIGGPSADEARPAGQGGPGDQGPDGAGELDIQKLADKVYRLMIAEARLERARGRPAQRPSAR